MNLITVKHWKWLKGINVRLYKYTHKNNVDPTLKHTMHTRHIHDLHVLVDVLVYFGTCSYANKTLKLPSCSS